MNYTPRQQLKSDLQNRYGLFNDEAKDLIELCLNHSPANRPHFDYLPACTENATGGIPDRSEDMLLSTAILIRGVPDLRLGTHGLGFTSPKTKEDKILHQGMKAMI